MFASALVGEAASLVRLYAMVMEGRGYAYAMDISI
jgi:hypothetical protein